MQQHPLVGLADREHLADVGAGQLLDVAHQHDLALPFGQRVEHHLAGCPHCTEYLAQMRETIRLAGRVAPEDLTPVMRADLTDVYRRWRAEG